MVWFRRLAGVTIFFTFVQIILGGVTRLTNSGLSCPDWPRCYGMLVPTPDGIAALGGTDYAYFQIMLEWVHRLTAGAVVGPLVLILTVLAWRLASRHRGLFGIMVTALLLVIIQAGLGGLTVLDRNSPWSVAVHLSVALLFLAVLLLAYRRAGSQARPDAVGGGIHALAGIAALIALVTVASGAMMAKSGASLACTTWPFCNGAVIPDMADPYISLHYGHRLLALIASLLTLGLAASLRGMERGPVRKSANMAASVVVLQVALGAGVVLMGVPVWIGALHLALGVIVFGSLASAFWAGSRLGFPSHGTDSQHGAVSRA
ncbi:MAG: hypothetical protein CMM50_07230 [Rhodospirillaceae bacterium]|nr:hypothetical protein [Rhodospirillaceae bacterium]